MGWTYTDLQRNRLTLDQAKQNHVRQATQYSDKIARIIMHEWHANSWYALIGFYDTEESTKPNLVFFRTDIIDQSALSFGYKDLCEEMGPHMQDRPSRAMAKLVFKYIPHAPSLYARDFRDFAGIPYLTQKQLELAI